MRKNYAASVLSALETISRRGEVHIGADLTEADHCEVMDDLLACGILVRKGEGEAYISPLPVVTLKLFLPLLFSGELRLRPVSIPGCPLHFCTAIWKSDAREADGVTKNAGAVIAGGQDDLYDL